MLHKLKQIASRNLVNMLGWRTDRKIVVFESDDWGSIRMPSKEVLLNLAGNGVKVNNCHYVQNDSLASAEDLMMLFEILTSYRGFQGEHPKFTANVIMANPNFEKIKASNFREYHYELFTETLKRYPQHDDSFNIWKQGMRGQLFHPQFHGREHLQVNRWLIQLINKHSETRRAFDLGLFGLSTSTTSENRKSYMAAFDWDNQNDKAFILNSIKDGLQQFRKIFGFSSLSVMAPNYTWHKDVEKVFFEEGIRYLQGASVQRLPRITEEIPKYIRHHTGEKNDIGQIYLVRNCRFEPSSRPSYNWVDSCLNEIRTSFFWKKPAIIESHRVNYIGSINQKNRNINLKLLNTLLKKIVTTWPEVEFMTSDQLGKVIRTND